MQCYNCGRERPRTGDCPNCGAPLQSSGSSYSSMRNWRDQSPPSGPRNSRPNPQDQRPISRPVDPSRNRGSSANWGSPNQSYARRGDPGQSYPRRDANQSYPRRDGYDEYGQDDRALMVSPGGGLVPQTDDRALPALPSEEEERALGIRRPAFIPATDERKGAKPGRWRVVSGVLSIMLLCVGACGVSSFLVRQNVIPQLNLLLGFTRQSSISAPVIAVPTQFVRGVPLVTPVPGAKTPIQPDIETYSQKYSQPGSLIYVFKQPTSVFAIGQTIYVAGSTTSDAKAGDTVSVKWFFDNSDITSQLLVTNKSCCLDKFKGAGAEQIEFDFTDKTSIGTGYAQISYNGTVAYTVLFYVGPSTTSQGTATPVPAKPTAAPTKHP